MIIYKHAKMGLVAAIVSLSIAGNAIAANDCATEVESVLDQQRTAYIDSFSDLATKNFSQRPGSFASTTCLDNLMKGGGMDIFFKPPSLDGILNMVKNLACEQASQIFNKALGGSGLNGGSVLNPGELLSGINMGSSPGSFPVSISVPDSGYSGSPILGDIFK